MQIFNLFLQKTEFKNKKCVKNIVIVAEFLKIVSQDIVISKVSLLKDNLFRKNQKVNLILINGQSISFGIPQNRNFHSKRRRS